MGTIHPAFAERDAYKDALEELAGEEYHLVRSDNGILAAVPVSDDPLSDCECIEDDFDDEPLDESEKDLEF